MVTPRKTESEKTRAAFGRAFGQLTRGLPSILVRNWRNVLMPWRMLPYPIALALIGLVALAIVFAPPETTDAERDGTITLTLGDYVPGETSCEEDAVFDHVSNECIHVDRILSAECMGATRLEYEIEGGSPTCSLAPTTALCGSDADCASKYGGDGSPRPAVNVNADGTECVTTERTYQDGTSEINAYGVCPVAPLSPVITPTATP
jgi:hypothetical protein